MRTEKRMKEKGEGKGKMEREKRSGKEREGLRGFKFLA